MIFGIAFAFFKIQNAVTKGGIRPTAEMELEGMDIPEMGALAYPEFEFAIEQADPEIGERPLVGSTGGHVHRGRDQLGRPDHPTAADRAGTARPCPPGRALRPDSTDTAAWTPPRSSATS